MKLTPVEFNPFEDVPQAKLKRVQGNPVIEEKKPDPTEGTGLLQRMREGAGKAFWDVGMGAGQILGLVDQQTVDEEKRLSKPLMDTGGGLAGISVTAGVPSGNALISG